MTSTIGIPIKLLNEAQVCARPDRANLVLTLAGPCYNSRTHLWADVPRKVARSRGQHEHSTAGHHCHRSRRPCQPLGSRLHSRQPREILHCSRHVTVSERRRWEGCLALRSRTDWSVATHQCFASAQARVGVSEWLVDARLSTAPAVSVEEDHLDELDTTCHATFERPLMTTATPDLSKRRMI